ncbi:fatty acid hydroxylase superfamily-domain-containing protein [Schizophyllum commune]
MDFILSIADEYLLDRVWARLVPVSAFVPTPEAYAGLNSTIVPSKWSQLVSHLPHPPLPEANAYDAVSAWPRDYIPRQMLSLTALTLVGIHLLYFAFSWLSYTFIFDKRMMRHPKFLKDQVRLEIITSLKAFPVMMLLTLPWFQAEVMGYSRLYDDVSMYGWPYLISSVALSFRFLVFTDYCIYWIHRWLHIPWLYKRLHKPHHKWIVPTPWASFAFHPLDGYLQSIPYHLFVFIFPFHRFAYLGLFVVVNFWTILIHDSDMITGHPLENIINGPAHHTLHHVYFTVNYGQYFTWSDRQGGSYMHPDHKFDPLLQVKDEKKVG